MKILKTNQGIWAGLKITVLSFLLVAQTSSAQTNYKLAASGENNVKVSGTSNVHDWTMNASGLESSGVFKFNGKEELIDVASLKFTVMAKSLKSGKSSMDSRTYKVIKADEFPKIAYQLTAANVTPLQVGKYTVHTTGNLTIAGKTQAITMKVMVTVNSDRSITCHGTEKLILTDYGIDPPSFMLEIGRAHV